MQVLKTIPAVPAIAEIPDSVYTVNVMSIDFVAGTVSFTVRSSYVPVMGMNTPETAPVSRTVSFAEVGALVLPADVTGFVAVVRQALALSMNVAIEKVPIDIFAV